MPDNTIILDNVSGNNIIFRNFRGVANRYNNPGDRNFCLIIPTIAQLVRDQLIARGCNIKKFKDTNGELIEFVNVAVRVTPARNMDYIWSRLDLNQIDEATLEFAFHEYNINGKKGTRIYLKNARFIIKILYETIAIDIQWPGNVTCTVVNANNTNNTEETNMEKMTRAEVMGQLQMGITAFEMDEKVKKDPIVTKLMCAMKNAIEYIGDDSKNGTRVKTVTVKEKIYTPPTIKQVIYNDPATVVIWNDDTKTVVKCQEGDTFDKEKGLAMAICKRMMGNKSNFNNALNKWANPELKKSKKKVLNTTKKGRTSPAVVNTDKMVVITDAYVECVRKKMSKRGFNYDSLGAAVSLGKSTVNRYFSSNIKSQKPKRMKIENFKKINKALGIRWKIEE